MGEPSAVLLLNCSPDTMSSRVQCRGRSSSSSSFHPGTDRDGAVHRRAESFCNNSQAVAAHYERKRLLHTVRSERFRFVCLPVELDSAKLRGSIPTEASLLSEEQFTPQRIISSKSTSSQLKSIYIHEPFKHLLLK